MSNSRWKLIVLAVAAGVLVSAGAALAAITFTVNGDGTQEVPANGSTATLTATLTLDCNANTLSYSITHNVASETAAHIHGFAGPGVNAGVQHPLPPGSPKVGVWNYPQSAEAEILAGRTYINVHSSTFPGGEIRGQIQPPVPGTNPLGLLALGLALAAGGAMLVMRRRTALA